MLRSAAASILCGCTALLAGGCYQYQVVSLESLRPGMDIRAMLSEEASLGLREALGEVRLDLQGEVLEVQNRSVLLAVPEFRTGVGFGNPSFHQRVRLGPGEMLRVELRTLNRGRTWSLVGAVGVGLGFLIYEAVARGWVGGPTEGRDTGGEV
jgi:hypothetical protein